MKLSSKLYRRLGACCMAFILLFSTVPLVSCGKKGDASSSSSSSGSSSSSKSDKSSKSNTNSKSSKDKEEDDIIPAEALPSGETASIFPPPPFVDELRSKNIYIINLDSGKEVWAQGADERIHPASITKIMTCLLALEYVEDLDGESTTLTTDINNYLYEQRIDTLGGISMGESFCIRDLLYAMMLQSANEAAMMVGKYVSTKDSRAPEGGDLEVFAEMMNEKAREIGALNTHFVNPTGLSDDNHYSTAKDMALIAKYAWEHPKYGETFQEIVSTNAYTSKPTNRNPNGITWYSIVYPQQNSQSDYYIPDLHGIKTGTLFEPDRDPNPNIHNFVTTVSRDGYTYLFSVCGAPVAGEDSNGNYGRYAKNLAFVDTKLLANWVFETFQVKTLVNVGDTMTQVAVNLSWDEKHVDLIAAEKFASLVTVETNADNVQKDVVLYNAKKRMIDRKEEEKYFDAPINKGDELGYVRITTAGNLELGRVRLVAAKSIERSDGLYYMSKFKEFMGKFVFKFLLTFLIIIAVLYILLMIIRNRNKKRYRMKRRPPRPPANRKN